MAENLNDGNLFVYWLPACADIDAPTAAEITAGTKLSDEMKLDDLSIGFAQNEFDNSNAESAFMATGVGTYAMSGPITIVLDDNSDKVLFDAIARYADGFLLVSRHGAPTTSDRVEVYPCEAHGSRPITPASGEKVKFQAAFSVTVEPSLTATVAA